MITAPASVVQLADAPSDELVSNVKAEAGLLSDEVNLMVTVFPGPTSILVALTVARWQITHNNASVGRRIVINT